MESEQEERFGFGWPIMGNESGIGSELNDSLSYDNGTSSKMELPLDMRFNDGHLLSVISYSVLMFFSAIGNLSVLNSMIKIRMKARLNRVNLMLLHLAIADLLVTFLMMPLEIGWNLTVSWEAGDFMCRLMSFFRTFGIYLSGFIIICISLDRYFAVLHPMTLPEANRRGRIMLYISWITSFLCSLPQSWVFHLESHPVFTWYKQCITLNSFASEWTELSYNFFGFIFMYGLPMITILFCYLSILYEIYKVNALRKNGDELRRSSMEALTRAKVRTLKMTLVIVLTFFLCWTPYNIMSLWYWFDKDSARAVDQRIQKCLFIFACTNSLTNPLIYGLFHIQNHQRSNKENRRRQNLLLANNYRMQRIDRPPYGVRVRWKPRDCLCTLNSSESSSGCEHNIKKIPLQHYSGNGVVINEGFRQHTNANTNNTRSTLDMSIRKPGLSSREYQRHILPAGSSMGNSNGHVRNGRNNSVECLMNPMTFTQTFTYRTPTTRENNNDIHLAGSSRRHCTLVNNSTTSFITSVVPCWKHWY